MLGVAISRNFFSGPAMPLMTSGFVLLLSAKCTGKLTIRRAFCAFKNGHERSDVNLQLFLSKQIGMNEQERYKHIRFNAMSIVQAK